MKTLLRCPCGRMPTTERLYTNEFNTACVCGKSAAASWSAYLSRRAWNAKICAERKAVA